MGRIVALDPSFSSTGIAIYEPSPVNLQSVSWHIDELGELKDLRKCFRGAGSFAYLGSSSPVVSGHFILDCVSREFMSKANFSEVCDKAIEVKEEIFRKAEDLSNSVVVQEYPPPQTYSATRLYCLAGLLYQEIIKQARGIVLVSPTFLTRSMGLRRSDKKVNILEALRLMRELGLPVLFRGMPVGDMMDAFLMLLYCLSKRVDFGSVRRPEYVESATIVKNFSILQEGLDASKGIV